MLMGKCDFCGVSFELSGYAKLLGEHQGNLKFSDQGVARASDLCESCMKKVVDFLVTLVKVPLEPR